MNLKERLENKKINNNLYNKNRILIDGNYDVDDVFIDDADVKQILINLFASYKNIVYVCDKSIDNTIIANYFYYLSSVYGSTIINNVDGDIEHFNNRISIIPNPNINEVVKIFEYILYGYKSFVFGLNFSTSKEIINKLKTVIAINYPNLNNLNIDTLLGFSNVLFVNISSNSDGLYYISEINELIFDNKVLSLKSVFPLNNVVVEEQINNTDTDDEQETEALINSVEKTEEIVNIESLEEAEETEEISSTVQYDEKETISETSVEDSSDEDIVESDINQELDSTLTAEVEFNEEIEAEADSQSEFNEISKENFVQEEDIPENISENEVVQNKVNKYKLLKEKIKNKRNV